MFVCIFGGLSASRVGVSQCLLRVGGFQVFSVQGLLLRVSSFCTGFGRCRQDLGGLGFGGLGV